MMNANTATDIADTAVNNQPPAGAAAEHQTGANRAYIPAASQPPASPPPDASAEFSHLVAGDAFLASLASLIEPVLVHHGWNLVRVRLFGGQRAKAGKESRLRIQIMAEPAEERPMTVEDCAAISRLVSPVMDVENLIDSRYTLEVSSPGIDRPLTRVEDFHRFQGCRAEIELADAAEDGRKRFTGTIKPPETMLSGQKKAQEKGQAAAPVIRLSIEGQVRSFPFPSIVRARLLQEDDAPARPAKTGRGRGSLKPAHRTGDSRGRRPEGPETRKAGDPKGRRPEGPASSGTKIRRTKHRVKA